MFIFWPQSHSSITHARHKQLKRQKPMLEKQMFDMFLFFWLSSHSNIMHAHHKQTKRQKPMLKNKSLPCSFFGPKAIQVSHMHATNTSNIQRSCL